MLNWILSMLGLPLITMVLRIGLIVLLALLGSWGIQPITRRLEHRLGNTLADPQRREHLKTLGRVGRDIVQAAIVILAGLMVLYTMGINITPLLASAGVAGLALSLGAQTLIKDFIGGALILAEDQFKIGSVVKIGVVSGTVERITLRATFLRDGEGSLHLIPNGDIRLVSNLMAEWAQAIVDLNISYEENMDKVTRALQAAAQTAQNDEAIKEALLEPPKIIEWSSFTDWAMQVRLTAKTSPGKQGDVASALRKHALEALRAEGVRLAIPIQEVRQGLT